MNKHEEIPGYTPAKEVRRNYKLNKYNRWFSENKDHTNTAQRRFGNEFFYCGSNIGERKLFSRSASVFTMGSCFARNIEQALRTNGISVLSDRLAMNPDHYTAKRSPSAALNKFNIPSMLSDFEKAFGLVDVDDRPFIPLDNDLYFDTSTAGLKLLPIHTLREVQALITEYNKSILRSNVFIITLGLVEMFRDNHTGCVLNTSPHPLTMRKFPGRFDHFRPTYGYLKAKLDKLLDLVSSSVPNLEVVITVSPVPLQSTMTSEDVVVTNCYSKSLLRVLAHTVCEERENVSYFPSYEMVVNSPADKTWENDRIHVKGELVNQVTATFVKEWFK